MTLYQKPVTLAVVLTSALILGACGTTRPASVSGECQIFEPLYGVIATTSDGNRRIAGHNAAGAAACGWKRNSDLP